MLVSLTIWAVWMVVSAGQPLLQALNRFEKRAIAQSK